MEYGSVWMEKVQGFTILKENENAIEFGKHSRVNWKMGI